MYQVKGLVAIGSDRPAARRHRWLPLDINEVGGVRGPDHETENALPRAWRQYGARLRQALRHTLRLPVEEEKGFVLDDGSPDSRPILIADQNLPGNSGPIVEPVVGIEECVAVVFEQAAMELVRALARHHLNLGAGVAAVFRFGHARDHPVLAHRVGVHQNL